MNLLASGLHKIHIISNTVFHAARNLQGEGVDVAAVSIELLYNCPKDCPNKDCLSKNGLGLSKQRFSEPRIV